MLTKPVHIWLLLNSIRHFDPTLIPLARTLGLLAEQKQMLWRMSRMVGLHPECLDWASSTSSSKAPLSLRIICCPSSPNDTFRRSLSQRDRTSPVGPPLRLPALGMGRDRKCCRKLLWKKARGRECVFSFGSRKWIWAIHVLWM